MSDVYINTLMSNYKSQKHVKSVKSVKSKGGGEDPKIADNNFPCGGFPPIMICKSKDKIMEENKNREFAKPRKDIISIKDIMQKRRDPLPFI